MPDFALPSEPSCLAFNLDDGWHAAHRILKIRLLRDAIRKSHGDLARAATILKLREVEVVGLLNLYCQWPFVNLTRADWNLPEVTVQVRESSSGAYFACPSTPSIREG